MPAPSITFDDFYLLSQTCSLFIVHLCNTIVIQFNCVGNEIFRCKHVKTYFSDHPERMQANVVNYKVQIIAKAFYLHLSQS